MKFSEVDAVRIPSGTAKKIRHNGKLLWQPYQMRYVSLGDSIAAGHSIDENWPGEGTQYGVNGNTETQIVKDCYTYRIQNALEDKYGRIKATSFARSGDTVADLMAKLDHDIVRKRIAAADIVTLCIGANDVLQPAFSYLNEYINGDMSNMNAVINANLATLGNDAAANSYTALFNKLYAINPRAKYVFTTIYNPYKYLHLDEGENGFFKPMLDSIPAMNILGFDITAKIKEGILGVPIVVQLFDRTNGLCDWAEKWVTDLNDTLRRKIAAYGKENFIVADTKAVFDPVPDRPISSTLYYNDLVNVEYTRGYKTDEMDWPELWENDAPNFWLNLATKHTSWSGFDIGSFSWELVQLTIERVIIPDVDPHPEFHGQLALYKSFADALGWETLPRRTITFNAGTYGAGSMAAQTVVALNGMTVYANINALKFTPSTVGYHFTGWLGNNGVSYSNGQFIGLSGDLTLTAQWYNKHTVTIDYWCQAGGEDTVVKDQLEIKIGGVLQSKDWAFSDVPVVAEYEYGTTIEVFAGTASGERRSYIYWNGTQLGPERYIFQLTSDVLIEYDWYFYDKLFESDQAYWICRITTR